MDAAVIIMDPDPWRKIYHSDTCVSLLHLWPANLQWSSLKYVHPAWLNIYHWPFSFPALGFLKVAALRCLTISTFSHCLHFNVFLNCGKREKSHGAMSGGTGVDSYKRVEFYLIVCMSVKQ